MSGGHGLARSVSLSGLEGASTGPRASFGRLDAQSHQGKSPAPQTGSVTVRLSPRGAEGAVGGIRAHSRESLAAGPVSNTLYSDSGSVDADFTSSVVWLHLSRTNHSLRWARRAQRPGR